MYQEHEKLKKNLVRKHDRVSALVAARCRWQDNIELYPKETGSEGVDWIHPQDRLQWQRMCCQFQPSVGSSIT
jgi:hypothetical protein